MAVRYRKVKDTRLLSQLESVLGMQGAMNYVPLYERFFALNATNWNHVNLQLPWSVHDVHDAEGGISVSDGNSEVKRTSAFFKYSPLLDPTRYLSGGYADTVVTTLPLFQTLGFPKLSDVNNSSYVDAFFYFLSNHLQTANASFHNGLAFYGTFLGLKHKFVYNLEDDYIMQTTFFSENQGKLFTTEATIPAGTNGSRRNCPKLTIDGDAVACDGIEEVDLLGSVVLVTNSDACNEVLLDAAIDEVLNEVQIDGMNEVKIEGMNEVKIEGMNEVKIDGMKEVLIGPAEEAMDEYAVSAENDSDSSNTEDAEGEDVWEDEDGASFECAPPTPVVIDKFPVQVIMMEKCNDTFDSLLNDIKPAELAAALLQIIFTLLAYQRAYEFTHNDLHTNNVMHVATDKPFLFYKVNKTTYRVPTFGRIFKIIDFGRSIYKYKGMRFMSDSFHAQGDAAGQYNCEPFYDATKPVLEPNYSFDLCRLACSMVDVIPDTPEYEEISKLLDDWCTDDKGKNVVFKKNGEERYPNFKLYKMITRTVHAHTPEAQLARPMFKQYAVAKKDLKKEDDVLNLDALQIS